MTTETTRHTRKCPEHYTRLDAGSMSHTHPDCGCWLARDENTGSVSLYQCPTHAAAPEMARVLGGFVEGHPCETCSPAALALLRKLGKSK